jgi:class III poly(R)-hydroxyalkanoic acid synthase PhaE subunit
LAHGGREEANAAVDRFNAQARNWYGQMQQVAARFAGQEAKPADITAEWKRALGAMGENPFPEMFRAMRGQGAQGLDQWIEDASPWLDAWRREGNAWLGMPTFGLGREHQERWQKLAQAQLDYQQYESAYNALMMKAAQRAYEVFEGKLAEREEPGRQLTSARALFDLWIDAAEEAYAEIALSPQFREAYGARINAQMRLRGAVQCEMERMSATFGMPTQGDLDIAFRKIAELERSLRRLRDQMATGPAPARTSSKPEPSPKPAAKKKPATRSGLKAAPPQASTGKGRQR